MTQDQGASANTCGRVVENMVEGVFRQHKWHVADWRADAGAGGDLFAADILYRNVPFKSIYGTLSRSEFVAQSTRLGRRVRIECKNQDVSGSVDEKLPYLFLNMRDQTEENEIVFVMSGDGFRNGAIAWLKAKCKTECEIGGARKKMTVMSLEEMKIWVKMFSRGET